ncbi:oxidoreductase, aldo/keto reductase family protein [Limosilactobacillus coleohominis 101-4-CHN]|uniref:Oxidoreductase, aldo/keto reductase family protein n=1 Tax=Limosilactobacillus coleohominis 101-4-CHN TaxID=575594 RepID=C7XTW0_9LACO|nr:aldo/keto reductase [Limosilactobacillus coleohominis]EEU30721.1 oxidoreductase, aldo/keto reductase family protein [Limosilactobacillus coleohominis 101-4-CHN]
MPQNIKLRNGCLMPQLAIGTAFFDDPEVVRQSIVTAFQIGYRHVAVDQDFAGIAGVNSTIHMAGLDREQVFITSKLSIEAVKHYGIKKTIDRLLNSLETSYVDALLMRNLRSTGKNIEAWHKMIQVLQKGQARAIGVVDFNQDELQKLMNSTDETPMIDQYIVKIGNTPSSLLDFCKEHNITVEAYSPVMYGLLLRAPIVGQLARKYQVSVNQLCIWYVVQQGLAVWRQTTNADHMIENWQIDFSI